MKGKWAVPTLVLGMIGGLTALVVSSESINTVTLDSVEDPCKITEYQYHKVRWPDGTETVVIGGVPQITPYQKNEPTGEIIGVDGRTYIVGEPFSIGYHKYMYVLLNTKVTFIDGCNSTTTTIKEEETTTTSVTTTTVVFDQESTTTTVVVEVDVPPTIPSTTNTPTSTLVVRELPPTK